MIIVFSSPNSMMNLYPIKLNFLPILTSCNRNFTSILWWFGCELCIYWRITAAVPRAPYKEQLKIINNVDTQSLPWYLALQPSPSKLHWSMSQKNHIYSHLIPRHITWWWSKNWGYCLNHWWVITCYLWSLLFERGYHVVPTRPNIKRTKFSIAFINNKKATT